MRAELGVEESGLATVIREAFELLHLISFFTAGQGKEARARAIERGTRARQAAGAVHTDMERGFVAAEITPWEDLVRAGGYTRGPRAGADARRGPRLRDARRRRGDVPLHALSGRTRPALAEIVRSCPCGQMPQAGTMCACVASSSLAFPGVQTLDVHGPAEVFTTATQLYGSRRLRGRGRRLPPRSAPHLQRRPLPRSHASTAAAARSTRSSWRAAAASTTRPATTSASSPG